MGPVEVEGIVGEDLGHVGGLVVIAGVLVVAGEGAAADAVVVDPDALVRFGWLLLELGIELGHGPPCIYR